MLEKHDEAQMYFGEKLVDLSMVRMVTGLSLFIFFFLVALLTRHSSVSPSFSQRLHCISTIEVSSAVDLLQQLKVNNLWEMDIPEVSPVLLSKFPDDLSSLDSATQKKVFLHALLPAVMIALSEVDEERVAFERVMAKFAQPPRRLDRVMEVGNFGFFTGLTSNDVYLLQKLCRKYRTFQVADLRRRINPVPVSLIMAQSALESGWGSSRLALQGNNIFGVTTWGDGLDSVRREEERTSSFAAYDSLLDSVRAYILMINRVPAYHGLRIIREETMDSLALAKGLRQYSERGNEYIADLSQLIRNNELQTYDQCVLADKAGIRGRMRLASLTDFR